MLIQVKDLIDFLILIILEISCLACPEGFNEFFNQRRRWMPSTIANIFDLLSDYKRVVDVNKDISILYIAYQVTKIICSSIVSSLIIIFFRS